MVTINYNKGRITFGTALVCYGVKNCHQGKIVTDPITFDLS